MTTSSGQQIGPNEVGVLDYPARKIVMACTNEVELHYRLHAIRKEPWTSEFVDAIPTDGVFYDIGACVGSYALIAATRGVLTVAIEPSAANYAQLVKNAMLNNCLEKMLILPFAVAHGRGLVWLDYRDVRPGAASHVIGSAERLFSHRQRIVVLTLDDLISAFTLPPPSHMKIDIDGGEESALMGMEKTLALPGLVGLMVEMPVETEEKIVAHLGERGFALADRFTDREGTEIQGILYGRFERVAVAAKSEPRELAGAAA